MYISWVNLNDIRSVLSESSLSVWRNFVYLAIPNMPSEDMITLCKYTGWWVASPDAHVRWYVSGVGFLTSIVKFKRRVHGVNTRSSNGHIRPIHTALINFSTGKIKPVKQPEIYTTMWNQSKLSSPDSLSSTGKYSRTNTPSLGCCVLCQSDWADYFGVTCLIEQHIGALIIKSVLFPLDFRKIGEPKHTPKKWAYVGRNLSNLTGVYFDRRKQGN